MTSTLLAGEKTVRMGFEEGFNDRAVSVARASVDCLALLSMTGPPVVLTSPAFSWRSSPLHDYALTNPVFFVLDPIN